MTDTQSIVDDDAPGELQLEAHFAMVPEWVLFHEGLSDRAVRLYGILLRFGQTSGVRMPGRSRLAQLLRVQTRRPVDRAREELEAAGALQVTRGGRTKDGQLRTNRYLVRVTPPEVAHVEGVGAVGTLPPVAPVGTLRSAPTDPLPIVLTQSEEPPPPDVRAREVPAGPGRAEEEAENVDVPTLIGIADLAEFAAELSVTAREVGGADLLWTRKNVHKAMTAAYAEGYPPIAMPAALRELAADPATQGPGRLPHQGLWWQAMDRENRQALATDLLEYAEQRAAERRAAAELVDARQRRQRELFEGLDSDTLEQLHAAAVIDVDQAEKRGGVAYSDGIRARLVTTSALRMAVEDGLVAELDAIDITHMKAAYA